MIGLEPSCAVRQGTALTVPKSSRTSGVSTPEAGREPCRSSYVTSNGHHRFACSMSLACCAGILAGLLLLLPSLGNAGSPRIHLTPNFTMGESFRYHIESRTTTTGTTTTPIVNPEAASQLKQVANIEVRLDVVGVQPATIGTPGAARLRATYEKAAASTETDAYDPAAASLDAQYNNLQGRFVEFTIESDGKISHITGLDQVVSNPSAAAAVRAWINGFSPSGNLPVEGISIGQKWEAEHPLENTPLANLLWRSSSSYLRDEPCELPGQSTLPAQNSATGAAPASVPAPLANSSEPLCAVILTTFDILRRGSSADATPEDYRHNGLRTFGTWIGNGQTLDTISLQTGMLLRSTQTSTQKMDFEIVSALSGSKMHYAGQVQTQSEVTLVPNSTPAVP